MQDPTVTNADHLIKVWEKVIDLQMHFNEMCMNLRRTAISVLGVMLAAGALSFRFGGAIEIGSNTMSVAFVFVAVALLVWVSFYLMDRFWYHQLLRSTVSYAESLQTSAKSAGLSFDLDVSKKIREENQRSLNLSGAAKINWFYGVIAVSLIVAEIFLYSGAVSHVSN
jgi:ABC-type Co2+ transport system permease subunit